MPTKGTTDELRARRQAYERSPERKAKLKAWRQRRKAAGAEPRGQTPERKAYMRAYELANKDRLKANSAAWRAANADLKRANDRAYREANLERLVRQKAEYYAANREIYMSKALAWQKANPEACVARALRRQAREKAAPGSHTEAEWRAKVAASGGLCTYCGNGPVVRDHVVPLIAGGTNDIGNVVPSCRSCNAKKGRRSLAEFLARLEEERRPAAD